jgi:hypothetical protein
MQQEADTMLIKITALSARKNRAWVRIAQINKIVNVVELVKS